MSMIRCDDCETIFDSDIDPDCFVEVPWLNMKDRVWCEACRDQQFEQHDREIAQ